AMRKYVETRIRGGGYGSVSEYIRELIRRDQNLANREAYTRSSANSPGVLRVPYDRSFDR
ncbi:MAG: type II toxin-antitoxin system ParD family antitoxin, partial [Pyrinomonadaceae bacterium]